MFADRLDRVARDCEVVRRPAEPAPPPTVTVTLRPDDDDTGGDDDRHHPHAAPDHDDGADHHHSTPPPHRRPRRPLRRRRPPVRARTEELSLQLRQPAAHDADRQRHGGDQPAADVSRRRRPRNCLRRGGVRADVKRLRRTRLAARRHLARSVAGRPRHRIAFLYAEWQTSSGYRLIRLANVAIPSTHTFLLSGSGVGWALAIDGKVAATVQLGQAPTTFSTAAEDYSADGVSEPSYDWTFSGASPAFAHAPAGLLPYGRTSPAPAGTAISEKGGGAPPAPRHLSCNRSAIGAERHSAAHSPILQAADDVERAAAVADLRGGRVARTDQVAADRCWSRSRSSRACRGRRLSPRRCGSPVTEPCVMLRMNPNQAPCHPETFTLP